MFDIIDIETGERFTVRPGMVIDAAGVDLPAGEADACDVIAVGLGL